MSAITRRQLISRWLLSMPALTVMGASIRAEPAEPIVLRTAANRFIVRLTGIERIENVNRLHDFELSLTTADGKPAAGASIDIAGQRRYAPNPLPTSPRSRPGPVAGTYRIEGLRFHMTGEWRLVFAIEFEQIRDQLMLDIVVK